MIRELCDHIDQLDLALDQLALKDRNFDRFAIMLSLYRLTNAPRTQAVMAESNVRPALAAVSVQHYPQMWVQGWEIRNLRMVANVLDVVRLHPGARVLSIVGASHKPWFDGWLAQMSGVDIVDAENVLKE